jgi:hypothetical protein
MPCKFRKGAAHGFELFDLLVELRDVLEGEALHFGARTSLVAP